MAEWGPWFDFGAVVLPTLLAIAGVFVTVEAPKVETRTARWAWRVGLVFFGLMVSLVTYEQQKLAREEARNQLEMNSAPSIALIYLGDRLNIENHGKSDLVFWGSKMGGYLQDTLTQSRIIAPNSSYYLLADTFNQIVLKAVGDNGETHIPFELYLETKSHKKFVGKFILWAVTKDHNLTVHTQMTALEEYDWRKS